MPANSVSLGHQVGRVGWVFLQGVKVQCIRGILDAQVLIIVLCTPLGVKAVFKPARNTQTDPNAGQALDSGREAPGGPYGPGFPAEP